MKWPRGKAQAEYDTQNKTFATHNPWVSCAKKRRGPMPPRRVPVDYPAEWRGDNCEVKHRLMTIVPIVAIGSIFAN
jgi:hypothetical protein